jgi:hypothetical protein
MGSLGWLEIKRRPSELWGGWRKKGGLPIKGKKQTEEGSLGEEREKLKNWRTRADSDWVPVEPFPGAEDKKETIRTLSGWIRKKETTRVRVGWI